MKQVLILVALICFAALAVDDVAAVPQPSAGSMSAVVGRQSPVVSGADAISIPQMLSYQGKLTDTLGVPVADTVYAVRFRLYAQPSGGTQFWEENQNVRTTGGLFSVLLGAVTPISLVPDAGALYLGMAVEGGAELVPRLRIASAAYAYLTVRAANSDLLQGRDTTTFSHSTHNHDATYVNEAQADAITTGMIVNGTIAAADLGQMGATANQVMKWTGSAWAPRNDSVGGGGGGTVTSVSQATGVVCTPNPITTTGTVAFDAAYGDGRYVNVDGDSLTGALRVQDDLRVYGKGRIGPHNYNTGSGAFVVGQANDVSGTYASITGGEDNSADGSHSHVGGGSENSAGGGYSFVGGGEMNYATGWMSAIAGGVDNRAAGVYSVVAGGDANNAGDAAADTCATVAGGFRNAATGLFASVGGGRADTASGYGSTVGGGHYNVAGGIFATISGGSSNLASDSGATAGGGHSNAAYGRYATVSGGSGNSVAGDCGAIGGGYANRVSALGGTVAGGYADSARARYCAVLGGNHNVAGRHPSDTCATVCGGQNNTADTAYAFVGGGSGNTASALWSTVGGGSSDTAAGYLSGVFCGRNNRAGDETSDTAAVVAGGYGNRATGKFATVGGGRNDTASGSWSTVGGGSDNNAASSYATVGGGHDNVASAASATVCGGNNNNAASSYATVGGGRDNNAASNSYATVGGGNSNDVTGYAATIGGGYNNDASGYAATIGGGYSNDASGSHATVPGGYDCAASGNRSFAAGDHAKARGAGSFVWSDSCGAGDTVQTTTANRWVARARGGVYFYTNLGMTTGAYLAPYSNSWESACDSMTKEDFRPVDRKALLDKVAALRVRNYKMKDQNDGTRHIGPVAQDFHNAFGYGGNETSINMADADGVALAAIQALYEDNRQLRQEVEALKAKLAGQ